MSERDPAHDSQAVRVGKRMLDDILRVWPILLLIGGWGLRVELFMAAGPRFTPEQAEIAHQGMMSEIDARFDGLPPRPFRREFDTLAAQVEAMETRLAEHTGEFREFRGEVRRELAAILRVLED